MFAAGANVGTVDAVFAEQLLGHPRDRRRAIDLQIRNAIGALIPTLQDQAPVIHAVVVMEVREKRVGDIDGAMAAFDQAMVRAGAVIPDDEIGADLDQVSGALPVERWRGGAGPEERDAEGPRRPRRCRGGALVGRSARRGDRSCCDRRDEFPSVHGLPPRRAYRTGGEESNRFCRWRSQRRS